MNHHSCLGALVRPSVMLIAIASGPVRAADAGGTRDFLAEHWHVAFDANKNTRLCNLFVTMLQKLGMATDVFGSSTGTLTAF
jgi:hypothetical protein